jgi:hypothetical protein
VINVSALRKRWHNLVGVQRAAILLLIAAAVVEVCAFIAQDFAGYDSPYHIFWIREWHKLWNVGIHYPRWLPDSYHGFGEPSFYFYAPLTFFLTNVMYAIFTNASPQWIAKITILLTLFASGFTMWLYLRSKNSNKASSFLGALLYCVAPYRFFDYSVRSALSEHVAFIFIPLIMWGMDRMIHETNNRRTSGFFLLSFSFALLVIANLPVAVVAALGLGVYALTSRPVFRNLRMLASVFFATIVLASFYWLPAYAFSSEVQLHHLWTAPSIAISSPILSIFIGQNVAMSLYNWLGFIAAGILFIALWRNKHDSKSNAMLWTLALFIVLVLPFISRDLFNFVPPFTVMQRPERMTVLLILIAAVLWKSELAQGGNGQRLSNAASIVVVVWSVGVIILIAGQMVGLHAHIREYQPIDDAPEYAPRWLQLSKDWGAKLNTSFESDSQTVMWQSANSVQVIHNVREPYNDTVKYRASISQVATFRRSYWPGWVAALDGQAINIRPDSLGRLTVEVPEGVHVVTLSMGSPREATIGWWISAIGLFAMALLYFGLQWKRSRSKVSL